ncbi:hypothetical protein MGSAQ_002512 [marine sediment metagenome]|uniref:Uncharacterized protein n=1 Tax=marine sediment metagenome TaxID=412755 RepID=A0A1B6NRK0_9ZZZZ
MVGEGVTSVEVGDHVIPLYTQNVANVSSVSQVKLTFAKQCAKHKVKA